MEVNDDKQLLVIVFDVNPSYWGFKSMKGEPQITKCLDCILAFINSYKMLRHDNQIALIASHSSKSAFLYPSPDQVETSNKRQIKIGGDDSKKINQIISENFKKLMLEDANQNDVRTDSLIAGSISLALCYIHRIMNENLSRKKTNSRILVIKASEDSASQYLSLMNCIFAAQKDNIVIDACILGQDSALLQQACDMTNGLYLHIPQEEALLQYLLTAFLVEANLRKESLIISLKSNLNQNTNEMMCETQVDYRAACFCHRDLIEIGFVCSVCLSIFCQFSPICSTCETAFNLPIMSNSKSRKKRRTNVSTAFAHSSETTN